MRRPESSPSKLLTVEAVADYLDKSPQWVYKSFRRQGGMLYRVGGELRAYQHELDAWVRSQAA
ncbi:helix-turn-helix domain-containing protein [Nonomuraea basaltis]|uniref:helix-turn-helix domain-containing protein n=1 Tax=Nonomuraea basaltis TaxID=2495887 RepID=UPI0014861007|nr:helix-turn-helix domain-containing protein [Nonomuraea basaltis]